MKISEMTGNQKAAYMQVVHATDFIIGGHENDVQDGNRDTMPTHESLAAEIYDTVMTCTTYPGSQSFKPIREIKFAGAEWIKERIEARLTKLGC